MRNVATSQAVERVGRRIQRVLRRRTHSGVSDEASPRSIDPSSLAWYSRGDEVFAAMLTAIGQARESVCLETYIFDASAIGVRFREALTAAAQRDVAVRVLLDGFGSSALASSFWQSLRTAGGDVRVFNPLRVNRFSLRNHRKLLVCDERVAFVGGYNIAADSDGDGVLRGWRDAAVRIEGMPAKALAHSFERMFTTADFRHKLRIRLRQAEPTPDAPACGCRILLSGPGRRSNPLMRALRHDLRKAKAARIMVPYFLPTRGLRRAMTRVARRGGRMELMLPGKSDVAISKMAAQSLYRRLLRAGVRIFEYQPQMLHGKLFIVDEAVYIGSANLDPRSLRLNYEFMVRLDCLNAAASAAAIFEETKRHCREILPESWRHERSLWTRLKQRFSHFVLARLDPWLTLSQWRAMLD